jgi:hypothetical protein
MSPHNSHLSAIAIAHIAATLQKCVPDADQRAEIVDQLAALCTEGDANELRLMAGLPARKS